MFADPLGTSFVHQFQTDRESWDSVSAGKNRLLRTSTTICELSEQATEGSQHTCDECSDKGKGEQAKAEAAAAQNPSVHGLGRTSATNPLGRMSMSKPTEDQLEKASVVRVPHS